MTTLERLELATLNAGVVLLEFIPDDARLLFELIDRNRSHLSQWDDETATKYLDYESVLSSIMHPQNPSRIRLGIWVVGALVGTVNFTHKPDKVAEIGYWVGREFCGLGLATLATLAMIAYVKRSWGVSRLVAHAHRENRASQKVLRKAGFVESHFNEQYAFFTLDRF